MAAFATALLVYASAWLRRHVPDVFLAALLNSQPIGFYTPSQLIQDARHHGVEVLPADVTISTWDSVLEGDTTAAPVRLGMSLISGMRVEAAERIELAPAGLPFVEVADLTRRAALDRHDLAVLAHAIALRSLRATGTTPFGRRSPRRCRTRIFCAAPPRRRGAGAAAGLQKQRDRDRLPRDGLHARAAPARASARPAAC